MKDKREALLNKISALHAKTKARRCTEAEAIAAAEVARKLMVKYGLSLSELQAISSPALACDADGVPIGDKHCHEVLHVSDAIARYTNTRCRYNRHGLIHVAKNRARKHAHNDVVLVFFGLDADVQVAIYLTNTLRSEMDTEWNIYWQANKKIGRPT
jgi:hypothetical protein